MQEQYAHVHEMWESVQCLRQQFEADLHDMERGLFGKFSYVGRLDRVQKKDFRHRCETLNPQCQHSFSVHQHFHRDATCKTTYKP